MEFVTHLWLGMPIWVWLSFIAVVLLILAFDLGACTRGMLLVPTKQASV